MSEFSRIHDLPAEEKAKYTFIPPKQVPDGFRNPELHIIANMIPACASCNVNKHDMDIEGFREQIQNFVNSLNRYSTQYKFAKRYGLVRETGVKVKFFFETVVSGTCDFCKKEGKLLEHSIWDGKDYHPECANKMEIAELN